MILNTEDNISRNDNNRNNSDKNKNKDIVTMLLLSLGKMIFM